MPDPKDLISLIFNSDAPFTYRLDKLDKKYGIPNWEDNGKTFSTHKMAYGNDNIGFFVYPEIQEIDNELVDFTKPPYKFNAGMESALDNENYVRMPDEETAKWFTENYKNIDWKKELNVDIIPDVSEQEEKKLWNHIYKITQNSNLTAGILGTLYQESRLNHKSVNKSGAEGIAQLTNDKLDAYKSWLKQKRLPDTGENQITFVLEYLSDFNNDEWTKEYNRTREVLKLPIIIKKEKDKTGKEVEIRLYVDKNGGTYKADEYEKSIKQFNPKWLDYSYEKFNNINWNNKTPEEAVSIFTNTFERPLDNIKARIRKKAARYFYNKYNSIPIHKAGGEFNYIENMKQITIEIEDKEYEVLVAETEEEKVKGLHDVIEMNDNEGMLFVYDNPQHVDFWMKDTEIPLDIVFIDEDEEVISVKQGIPFSEEFISEDNVKYVLEVNQNSGIKPGDDVDFDDEDWEESLSTMHVIGSDGTSQFELLGGERIFSRPNTRILVKGARRAYKSKKDSDYKRLGKQVFKYLKIQDNNDPSYVEMKKAE